MGQNPHGKRRGPSDPTDYSSTHAPETQEVAEHRHPMPTDERLVPGGGQGAEADSGMAALDRDETVSGGERAGETDDGTAERADNG
jgi:hypothetical protein